MNGNLYQPTTESFGIVPIPLDVASGIGMEPFDSQLDQEKQLHSYLAQKQGTRRAVLPLNNEAEYKLFSEFMRDPNIYTHSSETPNWTLLAKAWNRKANEDSSIFYKV